jgi:cell division septal protein FtsQ
VKAPGILRTRVLPAIAATLVIALLATAGWYGYEALLSQPFQRVVFAGGTAKLARADLDALEKAVRAARSMDGVRAAARKIPWVRDVAVRRIYPDAVEITFATHEVLARWGDNALVSPQGEVFSAAYQEKVPRFRGPDGAAPVMAAEYASIARAVAPLASPISELRLSARGAWQVALDSGLVLEIGRGDIHARLDRFVAAWPQLAARGVQTLHADLRHANGFALRTVQAPR